MSNVLDEIVEGVEPWPGIISVMASERTPALLALDIGTSGIRAALFDETGREIAGTNVRSDHGPAASDWITFDAESLRVTMVGLPGASDFSLPAPTASALS